MPRNIPSTPLDIALSFRLQLKGTYSQEVVKVCSGRSCVPASSNSVVSQCALKCTFTLIPSKEDNQLLSHFGYFRPGQFPYECSHHPVNFHYKSLSGILIGIGLTVQMNLGRIGILQYCIFSLISEVYVMIWI